jgi:hypothetical protein
MKTFFLQAKQLTNIIMDGFAMFERASLLKMSERQQNWGWLIKHDTALSVQQFLATKSKNVGATLLIHLI